MPNVDLERALQAAGLAAPVRWDEVTGSTNATATAMASDGAPEWTLVGAGHQTQGRGRLGRGWIDREGHALLVSMVLRPELAPADAGIVTLLAGAAWAGAAEQVMRARVRCEWPNDLMLGGAKVGGILAEASIEPGGEHGHGVLGHVVVGSGINLITPDGLQGAAGLGGEVDPTELLAAFLRVFRAGYRPRDASFANQVVASWRSVSDTIGRRVRAVRLDGSPLEGIARDVDARGALVIESGGRLETVSSGEVMHLD